ncbi:ABC transporter ATP-binding protein [Demequina soli]|uniref:ABC transporter ATP-binding protein n=1 Tax=Demequina soli TaxID=1638987 RepID=UPI000783F555|nr:ABC transporter ATP-binding protein [Demequina soli]
MIALRDVTFQYRSDSTPVLDGVDLTLAPGALTALRGPSGCGKSTLMYLCGLMLTPQDGEVLLNGRTVSHLPDRHRSRLRAASIGFVFQDAMLDTTRSVIDNVTEGAAFTGRAPRDIAARAHALLAEFELSDHARAKASSLSGGQSQRVALCRALVKAPTVILADEPSGNLDRANGDRVVDRLRDEAHRHGTSVLVVTHDDRLAARCDASIEFEVLSAHRSAAP